MNVQKHQHTLTYRGCTRCFPTIMIIIADMQTIYPLIISYLNNTPTNYYFAPYVRSSRELNLCRVEKNDECFLGLSSGNNARYMREKNQT